MKDYNDLYEENNKLKSQIEELKNKIKASKLKEKQNAIEKQGKIKEDELNNIKLINKKLQTDLANLQKLIDDIQGERMEQAKNYATEGSSFDYLPPESESNKHVEKETIEYDNNNN